METALKHPPVLLERLVLILIPPAAREAMAGDLWERYRSPLQYAREALGALPFVIVSQARRNANLPVMGLQGILAFACFGGFSGSLDAVLPTLALLAALSLQAAYQGLKPPSPSRAALETILVAGLVLIVGVSTAHGSFSRAHGGTGLAAGLWALVIAGSLPLLSLFRVQLSVRSENEQSFPDHMTVADIHGVYHRFARDVVKRNRLAAAALFGAGLLAAGLSMRSGGAGLGLAGIYAAGGCYLLLCGKARAMPVAADFLSLRAFYAQELARQNQLRRFLWWLWLTPLLGEIYVRLIWRGAAASQPLLLAAGILAAGLLSFPVMTINSERSGRIRQNILLLARMRERKTF